MAAKSLRQFVDLFRHGINTMLSRGLDRTFLLAVRYMSWRLQFQERVANLPPRLNEFITVIVITWVRWATKALHEILPSKYTNADPYALLYVDPDKITHISGLHDEKRRGWVIDGEWDKPEKKFCEQPIPTAIKQHYENGLEWEDTVLAAEYDEIGQFERKCAKIERLHDEIVTTGYQNQRELLVSDPEAAWSGVNATLSPLTNEITVDIGRNGEILWNMLGKHRLSIAKVADVETVPVMVFHRHKQWQTIRNKVRNGEDISEGFLDRPDLDGLLNRVQE